MKSAKEKLAEKTHAKILDDGEVLLYLLPSDALRILRQVAREAYVLGRSHGIIAKAEGVEIDQRTVIARIIDGKKGRRK